MVEIEQVHKGKAIVVITIICLLTVIGVLVILYNLNSPNPQHEYGQYDWEIKAPALNECDINGHYYPLSSSVCTFNLNLSKDASISRNGYKSGIIVTNKTPLNTTPIYTCHIPDPYSHWGNETGWSWGCNNQSEVDNYTVIQVNGVDSMVTYAPNHTVVL